MTRVKQRPKQMLVVAEESASLVGFYSVEDGKALGTLAVGSLPHEITTSDDNQTLFVSNFGVRDYDTKIGIPGASISVIDVPTCTEKYRLYSFDAQKQQLFNQILRGVHGVALRPPEKKLLYTHAEIGHELLIFDIEKRELIKKFSINPFTHNLFFSPDGKILWLMAVAEGIFRIDPDSGKKTGHIATKTPVHGLKYSKDNKFLIASIHNQILIIDPHTLVVEKEIKDLHTGPIFYSDITSDNKYLVIPATLSNKVIIVEVATGKIIQEFVTGLNPLYAHIDVSDKFAYITNVSDHHISKINLHNFSIQNIPTHAGPNSLKLIPYQKIKAKRQINLAVALPLTGTNKNIGNEIMFGYEFWRSLVNRGGGLFIKNRAYKINIYYADDQSNANHTSNKLEDLIHQYSINILLAPYYYSAYQTLTKIAQQYNLPLTLALNMHNHWQPNQIAYGYDYFITQEKFSEKFYADYNLTATHFSAAAAAVAICLQQAILIANSFERKKLLKTFKECTFNVFYPEGILRWR